ncbi:hypothetical protein ACFY8W_30475 [Streptomyces sp. NPDC012637]|uniref:hypothetical protein n=1 Tax=Streptomyces sp. NPDC012637 TaxID=3364842 RepID=UPI0036EA3D9B
MEAYVDGAGRALGGMSREALLYNSESMMEFKKGIDGLIADLLASPAAPKNMNSDQVARGQFGGGGAAWIEANEIFSSYKSVLAELIRLSTLLSDCLEGLGIAVGIAKDGMEQTDEEIRAKMLDISKRTTEAKTEADQKAGYDTTPSGKPDGTGAPGTDPQRQTTQTPAEPQRTETADGGAAGLG